MNYGVKIIPMYREKVFIYIGSYLVFICKSNTNIDTHLYAYIPTHHYACLIKIAS